MFGLESPSKKKAKAPEFVFELEKELKVAQNHKNIKKKIELRVQRIKERLRGGSNSDNFGKYEAILHGYASLLKVMARFPVK